MVTVTKINPVNCWNPIRAFAHHNIVRKDKCDGFKKSKDLAISSEDPNENLDNVQRLKP